jgi:predicted ester cyclase
MTPRRDPCTDRRLCSTCPVTPAEVVTAFIDGIERGDDAAFALVAEDFVQHAAGPQGRQGFRQTLQVLHHDLDGPHADVHRTIAQNDTVAVQLTLHGRHAASTMPLLQGHRPTGKAVSWDFIHIFRVADGLIAEHWACRDDLGLLGQVGGAKVTGHEPCFAVRDVAGSVEHYASLGFSTSLHDATYAFARRGDLTIHLAEAQDNRVGGSTLYLHVDDADALAAEWRAAGVSVDGPEDFDYGKREGTHRDPDGNLLRFGSPLREN